jgi:macrolide-specific efflux system membrane fusion protein
MADGSGTREVTIGVRGDSFTQIVSGLNEGDQIELLQGAIGGTQSGTGNRQGQLGTGTGTGQFPAGAGAGAGGGGAGAGAGAGGGTGGGFRGR